MCLILAAVLWVGEVHAQASCGRGARPWLSIDFAWAASFQSYEPTVLGDLRAGFAGRDIDVCLLATGPDHPAVASVRLSSPGEQRVLVSVEDPANDQRVERALDLSDMPVDGRAFAVALATDELIWAAWGRPPPGQQLPPSQDPEPQAEPTATAPPGVADKPQRKVRVRTSKAKQRSRREQSSSWRFGLRGALDAYAGGQTHLGGDLSVGWRVLDSLVLQLSGGARAGRAVDAPSGSITSGAAGGEFAVRSDVLRRKAIELGWDLALSASLLQLQGHAPSDAVANEDRLVEWLVCVGSGPQLGVRVAPAVWLQLGVRLALPVRAVEATDGGQVATGASGAALSTLLGLGVDL